MQRGSFVIYFILFFFTEDPNVFIIPSKDVFQVKLGALWNVTCKATGNPMPFVHWRKEKTQEDVTPKRRAPEVVMLTISTVTEADLGNYTCVAENSQDVTTAHVKLGELSYFKTLSIGPARESNPRPPALQSSALPSDLTLPLVSFTAVFDTLRTSGALRDGTENGCNEDY